MEEGTVAPKWLHRAKDKPHGKPTPVAAGFIPRSLNKHSGAFLLVFTKMP